MVVPFAVGRMVTVGRESAARSRAEGVASARGQERLRVAQEVHDVVGHGLSAIAMQAEIALHVLPKQPEQAAAALAAISRTSKEALDELRATLDVVRRGTGAPGRPPARRCPGGPGLEALVARMARTAGRAGPGGGRRGVPWTAARSARSTWPRTGWSRSRSPTCCATRGPADVTVRLAYEPASVVVEVTDTGGSGPARWPDGERIGHRAACAAAGRGAWAATARPARYAGGGFRVACPPAAPGGPR